MTIVRVSVVIPTYNRAYILAGALQSVLSQSFHDFEVLVVDDASTDATRELVTQFADARVRYLRQDTNRGVGAARNLAVESARGEYISFLDSDDVWRADKLQREVSFLDSTQEIDAVFSDLEKTDHGRVCESFMRTTPVFGKRLPTERYQDPQVLPQHEMYLCLLQEIPIKPSALTVRRRLFSEIGVFNSSLRSGEDWEFLLRFARLHRFGYIDAPLCQLRVLTDAVHCSRVEEDKLATIAWLSAHRQTLSGAVHAANLGIADMTKHLAWHYERYSRWKAARAFVRGFLLTRDVGLLARAIKASVWRGAQNVQ
jgi:glycosyltransferase involved in cell wall biosynthesis